MNVALAENRSEVLRAPDPSREMQHVDWPIHRAHCDYQRDAEDRRHLAADTGEIIGTLVEELMAAGWSEQDARNAHVRELTGSEGNV